MSEVQIKDGKEFTSEQSLRKAYPHLIFPKLNDEVMKALNITKEERTLEEDPLVKAKRIRQAKVAMITVNVDGMEFDGDEKSQARMKNSIECAELNNIDCIKQVLADNSVHDVTLAQLKEAFCKSVMKMNSIQIIPYE